ncbi:MAG: hypothetical protein IPK78_14000 [Rhodospirillales bacterium]|nr:hypothetical protein [Rhodospirillales bacterium]
MAAAEAMGNVPHRPQEPNCLGIITVAERPDCSGDRAADFAGEARVVVAAPHCSVLGSENAVDELALPAADERHRRVCVVEGVSAGLGQRFPAVGNGVPSVSYLDSLQVQPPQQRRRIDQVEDEGGALAIDRPVEQRQHLVDFTEVEMIKREMPPDVDAEEAVVGPSVRVRLQPANAVPLSPLHLHHVRDGMPAPAVARLALDGLSPMPFGKRILAVLFRAECVHAEDCVMPGHALVPYRHGASDTVAQHSRRAGVKVDEVSRLQRQHVAGIFDGKVFQRPASIVPAAVDQMADRDDVPTFPRVRR